MSVEAVKIPDEAIRIRIIGNSNSEYDQEKKEELLFLNSLISYNDTYFQIDYITNIYKFSTNNIFIKKSQ